MKRNIEFARKFMRNMLTPNSIIYVLIHIFLNFLNALINGDILTYFKLIKLKHLSVGGELASIKCKSVKYPIMLRPGTYDAELIFNNIIRKEYGYIKLSKETVNWIIDAGGYIGDTSIYFLNQYKNCKIIVLEPDPENYKILKLNLNYYSGRVHALNMGLYGESKKMAFSGNSRLNATGGGIRESEIDRSFMVECTTIPELIEGYDIQTIDILKLDIEGAEGSVLSVGQLSWFKLVRMIIIEIHSEELLLQITKVFKGNGYKMIQYRSVWYCLNTNCQVI